MTDNLIERALDRAIERLRVLDNYAGRPQWDAVLREELSQALKAKDAEIERLKEASELLPEGEWTVELQEVERPDHHMLFAADSTDEAAERIATMEPEWRLIRIARKALGGRDGE